MSDHETTLRAMAEVNLWGKDAQAACFAGADALEREREAAERKARHTELQQRIAGHLDVCIYCDSGLSNDCAVGRALLRDAHDFNKAMPTEPTR